MTTWAQSVPKLRPTSREHLSKSKIAVLRLSAPVVKYTREERLAAVARYRAKRKRRLEAPAQTGAPRWHLSLPQNYALKGMIRRYSKMKAVADGKRRNSSGKFVKKVPVTVAYSSSSQSDTSMPFEASDSAPLVWTPPSPSLDVVNDHAASFQERHGSRCR